MTKTDHPQTGKHTPEDTDLVEVFKPKQSFEEAFPSLINKEGRYMKCEEFSDQYLFPQDLIEQHCKDNQKIKEAIEKCLKKEYGDGDDEYRFADDLKKEMRLE